jgi:hypothetical protein
MGEFGIRLFGRIVVASATVTAALANTSLITTGSSTGSITVPAEAPYNSLTDTRLELRLTGIQPCQSPAGADPGSSPNYVQNWIRIAGNANASVNLFALGCRTAGEWGVYATIGSAGSPTTLLTPAEADNKTDLIVRMQKDQSHGRYTVEFWTPDGIRIKEYVNTTSGVHKSTAIAAPNQRTFIRGGGTVQIAWMRWYTGVVPLNSPMPKNSAAAKGDLGSWEFEGNLNDESDRGLHITLNPGCPGDTPEGCFAQSPVYPPLIQASVQNAVAGQPMTLDASASFTFDDASLSDFSWTQISGPTNVKISDSNSATAVVTGHVAGTYVFELSIQGTPAKHLRVTVENSDTAGLPLYPVSASQLYGTASVDFDLSAVQNAVDVLITVKKPDGRDLPPVVCTASPCTVSIDSRQKDHLYRIAYRDASGATLSTSDWMPIQVAQSDTQAVYASGNGETWNKFGFYLMQNTPNWVGSKESERSARYFGKRMWMGVNGVPMIADNPGMWTQARYIDGRAKYSHEIQELQDTADKYGWNHEDMLLHMNRNHRWATSQFRWTTANRFDAFERAASGSYVNGVLVGDAAETHGAFADRSDAAYSPAANDVALSPQTPVLYIGYGEPFAEANLILGKPASGCAVAWEYWNGVEWAALPLSSTGAQNTLSESGKVEWLPPAAWQRKVVKASRNKWWIRVRTADCSAHPALSQILADNWEARTDPLPTITLSSNSGGTFSGTAPDEGFRENTHGLHYLFTPNQDCSENPSLNVNGWGAKPLREEDGTTPMTCTAGQSYIIWYRWEGHWRKRAVDSKAWRGWCESSPTRMNIGLGPLEFDPTPPPECEAKFRYQARILFGWSANNSSGNFTNIQGGQYTYARHIVDTSLPHLTREGKIIYNGIFLDDMSLDQPSDNSCVSPNGRPLLFTEMGPHTRRDEIEKLAVHIRKVREYLRESHPDFYVGVNTSGSWIQPSEADWALAEIANYGTGARPATEFNADPYDFQQAADRYKPENNPKGVKTLLTTVDSSSDTFPNGQWVAWDRGNRGPISNWAGYLIVANENTAWFYCPNGGAFYTSSDEYLYWDEEPDAVLSEPVWADPQARTRTLLANFAGWPEGAYRVKIGEAGEFRNIIKPAGNNSEVTLTEPLYNSYPAGTPLWRVKQGRLGMSTPPPAERIFRWGYYFPAMDIDVGVPDKSGHKGGERDVNWIPAREAGTCCAVARRDFTRAIVLHVEPRNASARDYTTYSNPIQLGGTYYPLRADGTTGPGVTSIQLRSGEGAILLKEPVY